MEEPPNDSIVWLALKDFKHYLTQVPNVSWTDVAQDADWNIHVLPLQTRLAKWQIPDSLFITPFTDDGFIWTFQVNQGKHVATLQAYHPNGIAYGLFALLQEKLNVLFYHPRHTKIPPSLAFEKLQGIWQSDPHFQKRGFHLHTMHPIELAEVLHHPSKPPGMNAIYEYLDWLFHNGQNYFDFCLLRTVKLDEWIPHAKQIVRYGHQRGIKMGIDVSLHMIQQKSFQLYHSALSSMNKRKKQIAAYLQIFADIGFDYLNVEHESAEFLGSNQAKRQELLIFILEWMEKNAPQMYLTGRRHVVKDEKEAFPQKKSFPWDEKSLALDKKRGLMVHTVMSYSMTEPHAPVYENPNLRHMFELLLQEKDRREVWYYPETAYWITFDNSIPMLLLPYLSARLSDIDTCVRYGVVGHVTFSSGWEWGYWLFDWSVARWAWNYQDTLRSPAMYYAQFIQDPAKAACFEQYLQWQEYYLKDKNLLQWLTAMTITDEFAFFNKQMHPRPPYTYKYIRNRAWLWVLDSLQEHTLPLLQAYAEKIDSLYESQTVLHEIDWGVEITALRALHRMQTLQHLITKRKQRLTRVKKPLTFLQDAASIRIQALEIVKLQEKNYRYDLHLLTAKRKSFTAYPFGYLHTVSNLHFWRREELQAKHNWFSPFYKNIWKICRIIF